MHKTTKDTCKIKIIPGLESVEDCKGYFISVILMPKVILSYILLSLRLLCHGENSNPKEQKNRNT